MKRIFIAGATGYLGQHLIKSCAQQGWHVTALTRTDKHDASIRQLGGHPFVAQATQSETLSACMEGVDVVISALGITKQKDGLSYMGVDYQANVNLLEEAMRSGVKRFAYVSAFQGKLLKHQSEMMHAKELFVDDLIEASIEHTVIRPTGFFSDMGEYMTMAKQGRAWVIGSGEQQLNPIDGADLALRCLEAIDNNEAIVEVGGPELLSFNEIAALAFQALNKTPKISHFPQWLTKVTAKVLPIITPQTIYGPMEMFLAASNIEMIAPCYGTRTLKHYFETLR